nr:reverse transcriptase domain-containing protein [Tanacetum cinerariifolium]
MITRNVGRCTAATRGGGTSEQDVKKVRGMETKQEWYRAGHDVYTDGFHKLVRLVPHLVTPKSKRIKRYIYGLALQIRTMVAAIEITIIQSVVQKAGMLTDEAIRNGALKKITK